MKTVILTFIFAFSLGVLVRSYFEKEIRTNTVVVERWMKDTNYVRDTVTVFSKAEVKWVPITKIDTLIIKGINPETSADDSLPTAMALHETSRGRDSVFQMITFFGSPANTFQIKEVWNEDYYKEKTITSVVYKKKSFGFYGGIGLSYLNKIQPSIQIGWGFRL